MRHKVLLLLEKASAYSTEYSCAKILRVYEEQEFDRAEEDFQMILLTSPQSVVKLVEPKFIANQALEYKISYTSVKGTATWGGEVICAREESPIL